MILTRYNYFNPNYNSISALKNCVISGKIECQGKCKITNAHFRESSANIAVNSGNFTITSYPVRNSDIVLDVSAPTVSFSPETILNSRFSGEIQAETPVICGNSASGYNVFDFVSNQPAEYIRFMVSIGNPAIYPNDSYNTTSFYYFPENFDFQSEGFQWNSDENGVIFNKNSPPVPEKCVQKPYSYALGVSTQKSATFHITNLCHWKFRPELLWMQKILSTQESPKLSGKF